VDGAGPPDRPSTRVLRNVPILRIVVKLLAVPDYRSQYRSWTRQVASHYPEEIELHYGQIQCSVIVKPSWEILCQEEMVDGGAGRAFLFAQTDFRAITAIGTARLGSDRIVPLMSHHHRAALFNPTPNSLDGTRVNSALEVTNPAEPRPHRPLISKHSLTAAARLRVPLFPPWQHPELSELRNQSFVL